MKTTLIITAIILISMAIVYAMYLDTKESYENPEEWCIKNYSNESQRFIPWKCIKYFN